MDGIIQSSIGGSLDDIEVDAKAKVMLKVENPVLLKLNDLLSLMIKEITVEGQQKFEKVKNILYNGKRNFDVIAEETIENGPLIDLDRESLE
jgi:hypothetical protein